MIIGELATLTGCQVPTLCFHDAEGLLQVPVRGSNHHRDYGVPHADRLAFVQCCRSLDRSQGIRVLLLLLQLLDDPAKPCDEVNVLLDEQTRHVGRRIAELKALHKQIQAIRSACAGGASFGDRGALESLRHFTGASGATKRLP